MNSSRNIYSSQITPVKLTPVKFAPVKLTPVKLTPVILFPVKFKIEPVVYIIEPFNFMTGLFVKA